jgi:prepilin-type N-terminal cleavage/methylation domain-containing protein
MRATGEIASVPPPSRPRHDGFSLVEVLIAVTLLLIITVMISMVFQQASGAWSSGTTQAKSESAIRAALGSVERDLLNAVDARDYPSATVDFAGGDSITFVAFQHQYNHRNPRLSGRHPCLINYTFAAGLLNRNMKPMKPDGTFTGSSNIQSSVNGGMPLTSLTFTPVPRPSDPGGLPLRVDILAEAPRVSKLYTISGRSFGKNKTDDLGDGDDIVVGGKL